MVKKIKKQTNYKMHRLIFGVMFAFVATAFIIKTFANPSENHYAHTVGCAVTGKTVRQSLVRIQVSSPSDFVRGTTTINVTADEAGYFYHNYSVNSYVNYNGYSVKVVDNKGNELLPGGVLVCSAPPEKDTGEIII